MKPTIQGRLNKAKETLVYQTGIVSVFSFLTVSPKIKRVCFICFKNVGQTVSLPRLDKLTACPTK